MALNSKEMLCEDYEGDEDEDEARFDLDDDYTDGSYTDEYEEALSNCGMLPDGTCVKAGSEECDWECPFRPD